MTDAKQLIEDQETGAKSYRYIRTGTNHYSLAFTYDWLASEQERVPYVPWVEREISDDERPIMWRVRQALRGEGVEWPIRWDPDRKW